MQIGQEAKQQWSVREGKAVPMGQSTEQVWPMQKV
jgi:hypothetical protein